MAMAGARANKSNLQLDLQGDSTPGRVMSISMAMVDTEISKL
jgi:hypothetical protein